jgi:hypothetical protein
MDRTCTTCSYDEKNCDFDKKGKCTSLNGLKHWTEPMTLVESNEQWEVFSFTYTKELNGFHITLKKKGIEEYKELEIDANELSKFFEITNQ